MKKHRAMAFFFAATAFFPLTQMPAAKADLLIDPFQDRPAGFPLTIETSGIGLITYFPHVVGGRAIALGTFGSNGPSPATVDVVNTNGFSFLDYSSNDTMAEDLTLSYGTTISSGRFGVPNPGPIGLVINSTSDFLRLTFLAYNHSNGQNMPLDIGLGIGVSPGESYAQLQTILSTPGGQVVDIPLGSFIGMNINAIGFDFHAPSGTDFQLDSVSVITNIPEPESLLWLGVFLPILIWRKVRFR